MWPNPEEGSSGQAASVRPKVLWKVESWLLLVRLECRARLQWVGTDQCHTWRVEGSLGIGMVGSWVA